MRIQILIKKILSIIRYQTINIASWARRRLNTLHRGFTPRFYGRNFLAEKTAIRAPHSERIALSRSVSGVLIHSSFQSLQMSYKMFSQYFGIGADVRCQKAFYGRA